MWRFSYFVFLMISLSACNKPTESLVQTKQPLTCADKDNKDLSIEEQRVVNSDCLKAGLVVQPPVSKQDEGTAKIKPAAKDSVLWRF